MSNPPPSSRRNGEQLKVPGLIGRYLAIVLVFAALTLTLAVGWAGWVPTTWTDWLGIAALTPAGVGGVLLGDKIGQWLKDNGLGRQ